MKFNAKVRAQRSQARAADTEPVYPGEILETMGTPQKLWLGFGTLTAIMVLIVLAVFAWLSRLDGQIEQISHRVARATSAAHRMEAEVNAMGASVFDQMHAPQSVHRERVAQNIEDFQTSLQEFLKLSSAREERRVANQIADRFKQYVLLGEMLLEAEDKGGLYQQNLEAFMNLRIELDKMLAELQLRMLNRSESARRQVETGIRRLQTTTLTLLVAGVIIAAIAGGAVGRAVLATEQWLSESKQTLELRVADRTAELASANLALSRSNEELEQFASVASHDLQEPLRKIQAFGDRLQDKYRNVLDEQGSQYIARMQAAAARMRRLIDALLTFSRVTTKAQPFEQVDLNAIADEVLGDLEERLEETDGSVEIGDLPTIQADPLQIRQLLQNLVANGLKFHRPHVAPLVRIDAQRDNDSWWIIRVSDNGIGFDETYLDRIFEVFQRLHGRAEYEGTGMGLAICKKIAERHGGTITARSRPDGGATFILRLPARPELPEGSLESVPAEGVLQDS